MTDGGQGVESHHYPGEGQERLDIFLTRCYPGHSRNKLQGLIKQGCVTINHLPATKTGIDLQPGDVVEINFPPAKPSDLTAEDIPLEILFENQDLAVINKPAGLVVHPSPGHDRGTLVNAILGSFPDLTAINGVERPGIVHRLDKDTSGLIVIAKNENSLRYLQEQFKTRKVEKTYITLVDGKPPTPSGRIEAPIGRNSSHRKLMAVVPLIKGRQAVTVYKTLETFSNHTFLEIQLLTGRTHQIRVHMAFIGCPVAGDTVYGKHKPTLELTRQFLHAFRLKIILPNESTARSFEAPLPQELMLVLKELQKIKE